MKRAALGLSPPEAGPMIEWAVPDPDRMLKLAQAQGRVSVQADCSISEALVLMEERAARAQLTLDEIAAAVCTHDIWFSRSRPPAARRVPRAFAEDASRPAAGYWGVRDGP